MEGPKFAFTLLDATVVGGVTKTLHFHLSQRLKRAFLILLGSKYN